MFLDMLLRVPTANDQFHNTRNRSLSSSPVLENLKNFLFERNVSHFKESAACSRTVVLLDATCSMHHLLNMTKDTIINTFKVASQTLSNRTEMANARYQVKGAVYRNYNAPPASLYEKSAFESDPEHLSQFFGSQSANYGWGDEAIEIGLWDVNRDIEKSIELGEKMKYQVIIIGDKPPNSMSDVSEKREESAYSSLYTAHTDYGTPTYYETELAKLKEHEVPVHTFYVDDAAAAAFNSISESGGPGGVCNSLDIKSVNGATMLAQVMTERIVNDVAGGGQLGAELIEDCRAIFRQQMGFVN
jgi:hypothetical protein